MRVTEKIRFESPRARIQRLRERQLTAQERLSTGKRINRPSDDPLGAMRARLVGSQRSEVKQFHRALDTAGTLLDQADGVLNESLNTLFRIKELHIQAISSVRTQQDADNIADEIDQLREHLRSLANTQVQGRYLFAGLQYDVEPYDAAYAFNGDTNTQQVEVGHRHLVDVSVPGGSPFGDGTPATEDIFQNLANAGVEIRARNEPGMQTELENLEASIEQLIDARSIVGTRMSQISAARTVNELLEEKLPTRLADLQDTDFSTAVAELSLVDTGMQATMAVSSRIISGISLMDFLR